MIDREFVEKIEEMAHPDHEVVAIDDQHFLFSQKNGTLRRFEVPEPRAQTLELRSLQGVVDYINQNPDGFLEEHAPFVHIQGPSRVFLLSQPRKDSQRTILADARLGYENRFRLDQWQDPESFITGVRTAFQESEELGNLIQTVSAIDQEEAVSAGDDGISQKLVVRQGASSKAVSIKNPVTLRMFRTFHEVQQPAGLFLFRLSKSSEGPLAKLVEADCLGWHVEATEKIQAFIKKGTKSPILILR